ncbi:MAG TPA: phosphoribosylanthranilate isomerase [Candidatus Acidoferrales bacterium]|nr:phosphoribosylanthranilate isomerase [Candidatus Acidoferrales bacterium]
MARVKVKICGITNWTDARRAIAGGAELLGFNFYEGSPRYITPAKARRIVRRLSKGVSAVGVFVNETEQKMLETARAVGLDQLQLHGDESPAMVARLRRSLPVIKAIRVRKPFRASQLAPFKRASALLLDGFDRHARGGTGKTFDWEIARRAKRYGRIFLAGGLTPENIGDAIRAGKPYAVDVCSGVEARPGKKDPVRLKDLLRAVKGAQKRKR